MIARPVGAQKPLLDALDERASHRGIPYTRLIREITEREISRPER